MTTRHEIAVRVAGREFALVNPRCANLYTHVTSADIRDWLAAPERDLGAEWDEIVGDDFLGNYYMDATVLGGILYDESTYPLAVELHHLRDRYASYDIEGRARVILLEMLDNADPARDAAEVESESKEQHRKDLSHD